MVMVTLVDLIYIYQIYVQIFVNYINWFSSQGNPPPFFINLSFKCLSHFSKFISKFLIHINYIFNFILMPFPPIIFLHCFSVSKVQPIFGFVDHFFLFSSSFFFQEIERISFPFTKSYSWRFILRSSWVSLKSFLKNNIDSFSACFWFLIFSFKIQISFLWAFIHKILERREGWLKVDDWG